MLFDTFEKRKSSVQIGYPYDQDFVGIESRFDGYRVYGTTLIFLWEIGADSYESAIRGFWDGEIALNFGVI